MASSFHNKRLDLEYAYDSFGSLTHEYQEHGSAMDVATSPVVQNGCADGSNNSIRPTYIIYPDGRQVDYDYGTTGDPNDLLSRIETLDDSAGSTTTYQYFGTGQVISAEYDEPDLTYSIPGGMGGNSGLNRFGRVVDLRWQKGTNSPVRFAYGYDRLGNRLFERNNSTTRTPSGAIHVDALLDYDELNRLVDFKRGKLNIGNTAIASPNLTQDWTLDETGNWAGFDQGVTDALSQTRTHNTVNEITDVSETSGAAWATPAHDANGNQTSIPQPTDLTSVYDATWDAWNRLVELKDGTTTVATYQYDGQNRRVVIEDYDSSGVLDQTIHCYLSTAAQVLEERIDSSTDASKQFVWGLRFVDDLILRDRDTNSDGTLDERLYALHDLRFSIVAVANSSGTVLERYSYDAYGKRIVLAPNFTSRSSSNYAWQFGYTGRRRDDATGLYFFRARYYSAELGRFAGRDPLGFVDGMSMYRGYFVPHATDSSGFWSVERDLAERAIAESEKGDTVTSLAKKILLQAENYASWLEPTGGKLPKSVDEKICPGRWFYIPNTIFIGVGKLGRISTSRVTGIGNVPTEIAKILLLKGFNVELRNWQVSPWKIRDIPPKATILHGFAYFGHGIAGGQTGKLPKFCQKHGKLGSEIDQGGWLPIGGFAITPKQFSKKQLGFLVIKACHAAQGNWSQRASNNANTNGTVWTSGKGFTLSVAGGNAIRAAANNVPDPDEFPTRDRVLTK